MKNKLVMFSLSFFILIVLINIPYLLMFHDGLSDNVQDWSNYALYISGVLTPLVSFIGIMLVVKEYYRSKQYKENETTFNVIEKIETDLVKVLQTTVVIKPYKMESSEIPLINFLKFDKKSIFEKISVKYGDIQLKSNLSFELSEVINMLYLILYNSEKLEYEYKVYYLNKYFKLLYFFFYGDHYPCKIIIDERSTIDRDIGIKPLLFLEQKWFFFKNNRDFSEG